MKTNGLEHRRRVTVAHLKSIVAQVERAGFSRTKLAEKANISPPTINRKLNGSDQSVIKAQTLAMIEEAAAQLLGKPVGSGEALMAELEATNHDIAHQMDDLIRVLVKKRLLEEADLPPSLRDSLRRRRMLLELLGLPVE